MVQPISFVTVGAVGVLAFAHVVAGSIHPDGVLSRRYWLSFADGISISYVFLQLFPEITHGYEHHYETIGAPFYLLLPNPFFLPLVGIVIFYGIAQLMEHPPSFLQQRGVDPAPEVRIWIHIASFSLYKGVIGYLLAQRTDLLGIGLFTVAMMMHFLVIDYRLLEIHQREYLAIGRWILSGTILVGWAIGNLELISSTIVSFLLAFVAGGIVLIVLQEEFSREHTSSFPLFLFGVVLYSGLLLAL